MGGQDSDSDDNAASVLDDWILRADLALQLGVSVDTLARWESDRSGPSCIRLGRRVVYRRGTVADWLRDREKAASKTRSAGRPRRKFGRVS